MSRRGRRCEQQDSKSVVPERYCVEQRSSIATVKPHICHSISKKVVQTTIAEYSDGKVYDRYDVDSDGKPTL